MTGTLEALVSKIRALGLKHASRHQAGGPDEVNLDGMSPAAVLEKLFYENTIAKADIDATPEALFVAASRILGRKATGSIAAMTAAETEVILDYATKAKALAFAIIAGN